MDWADELSHRLYTINELWKYKIGAAEKEIAKALRTARDRGLEESAVYAEGGFDGDLVQLTSKQLRQIAQELRNLKTEGGR